MFNNFIQSKPAKLIFILLFTGVLCIVFGIMDFIDCSHGITDMDTMKSEEIIKGQFVTSDIYINLGNYAEEYTTNWGVKQGNSTQYYLVPFGDGEEGMYISVATSNLELQAQFDELEEALYSSEEIEDIYALEPIAFEGKIIKIDKEIQGYLYDMLLDYGFCESEAEADEFVLPYVVRYNVSGAQPAYELFVIGAGSLIACAVVIVVIFAGRRGTVSASAPVSPSGESTDFTDFSNR